MTVYVVFREDQNDHGYVDASIIGVFRDEPAARERAALERREARSQGLLVDGDEIPDGEWQVSCGVEAHRLS